MLRFRVLCTFVTSLVCVYGAGPADEYVVDETKGLGRTFDGIGGISGGGATSKLLINYPEPYRSHILDYLFLPNFGASLHILKVEIGGDGQSTDGTEASHMHYSWEENYERGYEWWLMVEAKKRNPNIKIYALPWSFPGWLNAEGQRNPYKYPERTATYVIKWIQGARTVYNITVDYVGIWNEKDYDKVYIKTLRKSLDKADFSHVKIVAPDAPHINDWKICPDILNDTQLAAAVEIVGCHYPGTITTSDAIKTGKPLWASEDYSTFNNVVGGGCWARLSDNRSVLSVIQLLNQNYVNGRITGTISWNLIAAYYQSLPYGRDGLMTSESPWSGHYVVETPIWMTAHTTQFINVGWRYFQHGSGVGHLTHGGSYVALESPDGKDLTIIIETMSHDHSKCIRPALPPYSVQPQEMVVQLKGRLASLKSLNMWYSKLRFSANSSSTLFERQKPVQVLNGRISLTLGVDEVITLTTLTTGRKGQHPTPPDALDFPLPYYDNFEDYPEHAEPYNLAPQTGTFEIIRRPAPEEGNVMRQMVTQRPIYWCGAELIDRASSVIGSVKWTDLFVSTSFRLKGVNTTDGVYIGARVAKGGCWLASTSGVFLAVYPKSRRYVISTDIVQSYIIHSGTVEKLLPDDWNYIGLLVQGNQASGYINGEAFGNVTVGSGGRGFAGLGTTSFGLADFQNVMLMTAKQAQGMLSQFTMPEINRIMFKKFRKRVLYN